MPITLQLLLMFVSTGDIHPVPVQRVVCPAAGRVASRPGRDVQGGAALSARSHGGRR